MGGWKYYYRECPECREEVEFMLPEYDNTRVEFCPRCKSRLKLTEKIEVTVEKIEETKMNADLFLKNAIEIGKSDEGVDWNEALAGNSFIESKERAMEVVAYLVSKWEITFQDIVDDYNLKSGIKKTKEEE